jgi:hypothetical protein
LAVINRWCSRRRRKLAKPTATISRCSFGGNVAKSATTDTATSLRCTSSRSFVTPSSRAEATATIGGHTDQLHGRFYNPPRRHSGLAFRSPIQ